MPSTERADLLQTLGRHRGLLRQTVHGITDDQARQRTTVSALTLGGLIKHVSTTEASWARFLVGGAEAMANAGHEGGGDPNPDGWASGFLLLPHETLAGVLADYEAVATYTDQLAATHDLDSGHPLPDAPWFEPGASWTARRVLLHIIAETAQHAGHADIIREGIDGAKTMG